MNKPEKDWGFGIPEFTENDLLKGLELQEFCTKIAAKALQDKGYTITQIMVNREPTQIMATKNGKKYISIAAGELHPQKGRIAFKLKKQFADYYKPQGFTPLFMSVALMPMDPIRAVERLALKFDGYRIKTFDEEDLTNIILPKNGDEEYKAYSIERICDAYTDGETAQIDDLFSDNIELTNSQTQEVINGKEEVRNYLNIKLSLLNEPHINKDGAPVIATKEEDKEDYFFEKTEGRLCALFAKRAIYDEEIKWTLLIPEFNEEGKIVKLEITHPSLFKIDQYYTFLAG